ncbi:hypothetical protein IFM89_018264 [Coptis chinensis]|uniref:Polygalacturonase n=1 Tax=Coptis chinensis TaxID=261450 RepID=A0A835GWW9_9MAGN|nr:hypothetical protein IFM89_018264 [Coptis chinensis]
MLKAPSDLIDTEDWMTFNYINGLAISGRGSFNGQGALAWSKNQCSKGWALQIPRCHGISIGSLGKSDKEEVVRGITVKNCTFTDMDNGVRIKTWPSSPTTGIASNFTFEDIIIKNVKNPTVIGQQYCPHNLCDKKRRSQAVELSDIGLKYNGPDGGATSTCSNVKPILHGKVIPSASAVAP